MGVRGGGQRHPAQPEGRERETGACCEAQRTKVERHVLGRRVQLVNVVPIEAREEEDVPRLEHRLQRSSAAEGGEARKVGAAPTGASAWRGVGSDARSIAAIAGGAHEL